jgi:nitric oxide reductase activation protein
MIDLRDGRTPSNKIYHRRTKMDRDVAVALLLDMSASTADPVDRDESGAGRPRRRIIDVEKEAIVLLADALELLQDGYGIYGFSGYGRKNVEFHVIKELAEKFSPAVERRIDRIKPLNTTRMGPAIRHAARKLTRHRARSRFLFLVSDGRPQDLGYSSEGEYLQYAVQDTRRALLEARRQGVIPFCLTVDREGHDYLKTMMRDMLYEVLWDVSMLPARLPQLYRKLTA